MVRDSIGASLTTTFLASKKGKLRRYKLINQGKKRLDFLLFFCEIFDDQCILYLPKDAVKRFISAGVGSSGPPSLSPPELRLSMESVLIRSRSRALKLSLALRSDMRTSN